MRVLQPFAVLGFSFAGTLFICAWLTESQMHLFFPLCAATASIGLLFFIRRKGALLLLTGIMAMLAVGVSLSWMDALWTAYGSVSGKDVVITGVSRSGNAEDGILVRDASIEYEGGQITADLLLYGDNDLYILPGERFSVASSSVSIAYSSQQAKGALLSVYADSATLRITDEQSLPYRLREETLTRLTANIRRAIPDSETAAMTAALLTGNDEDIPDRIYGLYQRSGIAHILCVSGLHLSILSGILLTLLTFVGRRPALLLSMLLTGGFVWLTGMGPSAVRAWIMVCLVAAAELFYRDATPVNSLGLAVLILTLCEPALVRRMGFLLSVTSVLAVTVLAPSWCRTTVQLLYWEEKPFRTRILNLFLSSAAVSLLTLPVMMLFMGYTCLTAPLTNMIILPLMPILLICGLTAGLTGWDVAGKICQAILSLFDLTASVSSEVPVLPLGSNFTLIAAVGCVLLFSISALLKGRSFARTAAALLSVVLLCFSYIIEDIARNDRLLITQYAFSRGSSIVVQYNGHAAVIGAGSSGREGRTLVNALLAGGVQEIDTLIIPADRLGYTGGSYALMTAMHAGTIISPPSSRIAAAMDFGSFDAEYPLEDSLWELFGGRLQIHTGSGTVLSLHWDGREILFNTSDDPVPWDHDIRLNYDRKEEETVPDRENYAIMVSSGISGRPVAALVLRPENTTKGAV